MIDHGTLQKRHGNGLERNVKNGIQSGFLQQYDLGT
jgi:hypothetical protein